MSQINKVLKRSLKAEKESLKLFFLVNFTKGKLKLVGNISENIRIVTCFSTITAIKRTIATSLKILSQKGPFTTKVL